MRSLYEELGVSPSADQEQLRRAYRQRARELHPDVNREIDDGSAMQSLNAAWAVLGDPETRRRYDEELDRRLPPPPAREAPHVAGSPSDADPAPAPVGGGWFRLVRPSVIIPLVLFVIFVVTAYAGHPGSTGPSLTPATTLVPSEQGTGHVSNPSVTVPASAFVGRCIRDQSGSVLVVPCSQRPNSLVIATVPVAGTCPAGTSGYLVAGQSVMVCADPTGP